MAHTRLSPCMSVFCAGMELATPRPALLRVPSQLYDDTPAAAEMVMPLKGRRVGVYRQLFEDASPDVVRACQHAVDLLKEHGCEVRRPLTLLATPRGFLSCCCSQATSSVSQRYIYIGAPQAS